MGIGLKKKKKNVSVQFSYCIPKMSTEADIEVDKSDI